MGSDALPSRVFWEDLLSYEMFSFVFFCSLHLFPFSLFICILGEKLASRVVVWFCSIELNWT